MIALSSGVLSMAPNMASRYSSHARAAGECGQLVVHLESPHIGSRLLDY